jgi:hypothetical protein
MTKTKVMLALRDGSFIEELTVLGCQLAVWMCRELIAIHVVQAGTRTNPGTNSNFRCSNGGSLTEE